VNNRLGVYTDDVYLLVEDDSGARISSDRSFLLFAHQVGEHFDEFVIFGRGTRADEDRPLRVGLKTSAAYRPLQRLLAGLRRTSGAGRT
jgi:hypothetical protein